MMYNAAGSDFSRLMFGGSTSSFPALKRSGAILQARVADDTAYTDVEVLDEAYGVGWNGSLEVPTKNAVYDQMELKLSTAGIASASVAATGGDTLTLANWFKWQARDTDAPTANYGYFSDRATNGDTASPLKMRHQLALGAGADEDFNTTGGQTWLSTSFNHYFARSATLFSVSPMGGAGGVFATRTSDLYDGNAVWTAGEAVTAGAIRGYLNTNGAHTLYTASGSGTTGATPPTHTVGSVSDGTVTWAFTQLQYRTPMGVASLVYNDAAVGAPGWAGYFEGVRGPSAGETTVVEIDVQNAGSDVNINPYAMFTEGLTAALWVACQQNVYGPAATAPSSASARPANARP
jgi:hypothetical protein